MTTYLLGAPPLIRWVERGRPVRIHVGGPIAYYQKETVLQYGLRPVNDGEVEWFDVPTVVDGGTDAEGEKR